MRAARRSGFTLIELTAALSIAGLAIFGGIMLLDQIDDASARIASARVSTMRVANGARALRQLLFETLPSTDTARGLAGTEHSVSFWTMCDVAHGWAEVCPVQLALDQRRDSTVVTAALPSETLTLLTVRGLAEFRYIDPAQDSLWMPRWTSSLGLPSAVVVMTRGDTLVYPLAVMHD